MSRVYEALAAAAAAAKTDRRSPPWRDSLSTDERAAAASVDPAPAELPHEDRPGPSPLSRPAHTHRAGTQRPSCTFDELIRAIARDEEQFDL